jgi:CubicO group peptidase (beta-lactamase class C family)
MKVFLASLAVSSLLLSAGPAWALCAEGEPCVTPKPVEPAPVSASELADGPARGLAKKPAVARLRQPHRRQSHRPRDQAARQPVLARSHAIPGRPLARNDRRHLAWRQTRLCQELRLRRHADAAHPDDLFRLESDSKQITGATILKLIHDGQSVDGDPNHKLTMDTKIFEVLASPPNAITPSGGASALNPGLKDLTLREAMYHTSGWANNIGDPVWYAGQPNAILPVTEKNVVETMETFAPDSALTGKVFLYNNFEYNLLASLIGKITGEDYESVVHETVLNPIGVTRTRVGESLFSLPNEAHYYAAVGSTPANSLFPAQTGPTLTTDETIPYGSWSLQAGRGAGGWIASAPDTLRFQLAVNGRGLTQVYPNIFADIMTGVDQPSWACDPTAGCGTLDPVNPATDRYNAGWGVHFWQAPYNGWELDHSGGVNGGISVSESIPNGPYIQDYGLVVLMNTSPPSGQAFDPSGAVRNAVIATLNANNGSLLDSGSRPDLDFFDQYGDFTSFMDFQKMEARIAEAKQGCTYKGQKFPVCYPSRLEGKNEVAGPHYHAEIVPLQTGDSYDYVLHAPCTVYLQTEKDLAQKLYRPINLQWFSDPNGEMRVQAVWVRLNGSE